VALNQERLVQSDAEIDCGSQRAVGYVTQTLEAAQKRVGIFHCFIAGLRG
jgi:hypothetical protein